MNMEQTSLFPSENPVNPAQEPASGAGNDAVGKDIYDGLVSRERYRKFRMDNDLRAKQLVYTEEADTVIRECLVILMSAVTNDIDAMPDKLYGKTRGEIREILVERYKRVVAQSEARLEEYIKSRDTGIAE